MHDNTTVPIVVGDATVVDLKRAIKRCSECGQHFGAEARFCPFDGSLLETAEWDPSIDSLLGAVIDERYEVCAVLGEGGMGTVYKVRHIALDRMFAMKVLRKDLARDAGLAARFIQEARATACIKHPNVVQITDFGTLVGSSEDLPYFVMELLVGQPLSAALRARGALPIGVACQIVLKIASALGAAHDAGIVHRDLKPENVFLVGRVGEAGLPEDVRVVDFGAAKVMGTSRITKTGIVFGTPQFMSPEQASGGVVDHRTDIYALGIMMYELFTGRVPFEADTYMGVLTQHIFVRPTPPSAVLPAGMELGELESIVLRALEKKPEGRQPTMEALADDVRNAMRFDPDGRVVVAPPRAPITPRVSAPPLGQRPMFSDSVPPAPHAGAPMWLPAVAGASLTMVIAALVWVATRPPPEEAVSDAPSPPRRAASQIAAPRAVASASLVVPSSAGASVAPPVSSPVASASAAPPPASSVRRQPLPAAPRPSARPSPPSSGLDSYFIDPWRNDPP